MFYTQLLIEKINKNLGKNYYHKQLYRYLNLTLLINNIKMISIKKQGTGRKTIGD